MLIKLPLTAHVLWLRRPSLLSTLALCLTLCGFCCTACTAFSHAQRMALAQDLAAAGDTTGSLLMAVGGPTGALIGAVMIAAGHGLATVIRPATPPTSTAKTVP